MDSAGNFIDDKSLLSAVSGGAAGGGGGGSGGGGCGTISTGGGTATLANMSVELCLVCGDRASGRHYGAISCEGCKGFFKRSIRKQLGYQCRGTMNCEVTKHHRNRCQFCRLQKCLASGMRSDSVQHERKPIIDKKELHTSISGSGGTGGGTAAGVIYHHRNKTAYGQQNSTSSSASAVGTNTENLSTVFPVGFNFADLTQTLNKRALLVSAPYQQQIGSQIDNFSCSPSTQTNDDDSMDNTGLVTGQSQGGLGAGGVGGVASSLSGQDHGSNSATSASVTAAAASLIQSSIDKHIIMQSLDLIAGVQQQYDPSCITPTNNNNTIVKDEVIIDEQQQHHQRKLITDFEEEHLHHHLHHPHGDRMGVELPILPEVNVNFNLQIPTLVPSYLNLHYVCECGSRILFLSVYWIKKIHAFQQLPEDIQVRLLRRHWVELFAIGLSQCSRMLSMSTIMTTLISNIIQISEVEKITAAKIRKLCEHTCQLHQFVQTMHSMDPTEHEFAYMRLLMVFSPDDFNVKNQKKFTLLEKLQDCALLSFRNHLIEANYPEPNDRCNKILLRLMQLTALESDVIEELFFSSLIGQVQIENMIPYILKLGGGGV